MRAESGEEHDTESVASTTRGLPNRGEERATEDSSATVSLGPRAPKSPLPTRRFGRFIILEEVGHGGMGSVYSAYDEQLDRKVAIKVLRRGELLQRDDKPRFLREARALARLSHPNVVTIHDVGEAEGELFLATEFIRGQSLARWLETEQPWQVVLEAYIQAGRGLSAAHEAGMVHRDLKPHNIMREDSGLVKVLDFGLARAVGDESHSEDERATAPNSRSDSGSASLSPLTRPGLIMGTPAYMSPEQLRGDAVDARSDQFSFCVALFAGLYGVRPFTGSSLLERLTAIEGRELHALPRSTKVPAEVGRAVLRGLEPNPEERWPSMAALLEVLGRSLSPRRRRWWPLTMVLAVGLGGIALGNEARPEPCTDAPRQLIGVWDQDRRAGVEDAIEGLGASFADQVWTRTEGLLDAYGQDWIAMHTEACEATTIRGEQSPQMLDSRMDCLRRASIRLKAVVDTLSEGDERTTLNAHELLSSLPPLSRCADTKALAADVEPPLASESAIVEDIRRKNARASALLEAGRADEALVITNEGKSLAKALEYEAVKTELALTEGHALYVLGRKPEAARVLSAALGSAVRWKQWQLIRELAVLSLYCSSGVPGLTEVGQHYWALAEAATLDEPLDHARARQAFAGLLMNQGELERAQAEFEAARDTLQEALGPTHPDVAQARANLAIVYRHRGEFSRSETELRMALETLVESLGAEHPTAAMARSDLATSLSRQGKFKEAEEELRLALSLYSAVRDPTDEFVARMRAELGGIFSNQERHEEAEVELRTAFSLLRDSVEPDAPSFLALRTQLGLALVSSGRYEEAEVEARAVLAAKERQFPAGHLSVARARLTLVYVLTEAKQFSKALPVAELLWAQQEHSTDAPYLRAEACAYLAMTLWEVEGPERDRPRARVLAEDVLSSLVASGAGESEVAMELARWLAER